MYIASKFISIFLTIFVYHLISKIAFHLLIVNEQIRNFAQIPITGARCVKSNMVYTLCKHMVYIFSLGSSTKR